ncbi:MAG: hypothetical protein QOI57_1240, partial [Rubrobacteraceae bacterium]|nr:hypothetical protein [Rubrobacteraceae bacterium]
EEGAEDEVECHVEILPAAGRRHEPEEYRHAQG